MNYFNSFLIHYIDFFLLRTLEFHLESIPSLLVCVLRDIGNTELISISASISHFLVLYCHSILLFNLLWKSDKNNTWILYKPWGHKREKELLNSGRSGELVKQESLETTPRWLSTNYYWISSVIPHCPAHIIEELVKDSVTGLNILGDGKAQYLLTYCHSDL